MPDLTTIAAMQNQSPQQQKPTNPFDAGIARAIQSARESLSARTQEQTYNSLTKGINTTAAMLASQGEAPRRKGLWGNLASLAPAIGAGNNAYINAQEQASQQNEIEADKLLTYQMHEQERRAQEAGNLWNQDFHERQLEETIRRNKENAALQAALLAAKGPEQKSEAELKREDAAKAKAELKSNMSRFKNRLVELKELENAGKLKQSPQVGWFNNIQKEWPSLGLVPDLNEIQTEIDTEGKLAQDTLALIYNSNTDPRFKALPVPSASKSLRNNIVIIDRILNTLEGDDAHNNQPSNNQPPIDNRIKGKWFK